MCLRVRIYLCAYFVCIFRNALIVKWLVCLEDCLNKENSPEIMPFFVSNQPFLNNLLYNMTTMILYNMT